jgi:hypothetical protein
MLTCVQSHYCALSLQEIMVGLGLLLCYAFSSNLDCNVKVPCLGGWGTKTRKRLRDCPNLHRGALDLDEGGVL